MTSGPGNKSITNRTKTTANGNGERINTEKKNAKYKTMWKTSCESVIKFSVGQGAPDKRSSNLSVQLLEDLSEKTGPVDLDKWDPELCIQMVQLSLAKVDTYMALKKLIQRASR